MLTSSGVNKKVYQPSTNEIKEMYSKMFHGKGGSEGAAEAEGGGASGWRLAA